MRYFPMFLDMRGRHVLLAGGNEETVRKARLLARTEARLTVMAPELPEELTGKALHIAAGFDRQAISDADYVFVGVEDQALSTRIAAAARASGALVNVIDQPEDCDFITPSIVDRDPVVVAIGTEGAAPVLGRRIKSGLEVDLSPRLGGYVGLLRRLRPEIADAVRPADRLAFWRWAVSGAPWRSWDAGDEEAAEALLRTAMKEGKAPDAEEKAISVIESPSAPDLAPLRALRRLQEAALIIHAGATDSAFLDLARRDADRLVAGSCPRSEMTNIRAAIDAAEGPVVIIAPPGCAARDWPEATDFIPAASV